MSLKEQIYSTLIVSASESFNLSLTALLPKSNYSPVHIVKNIAAAKRTAAEKNFDFIFINSPLPDDPGMRFAIDTCTTKNTVVIILVKTDIHDVVHGRVAEHGVFTLPKPISRSTLLQALSWMVSARECLRRFEKKTLSIEEKMMEIRIVNRAKWLLISEQNMTEPDAHRYLEKQAMDRGMSKRSIAEEIIHSKYIFSTEK
ncbi:MAG: ANTAR domain-containing protein [Coprococcus sp.]|nr:ANTAR domain-containing protein [Coprococcus sp.]